MAATPTPNTDEIVSAIALADCNLFLASERLARIHHLPNDETNPQITPTSLLTALSDDPEAASQLVKHLRLKALLDSYTTMRTLSLIITATLSEYEPKDTIKTFQAFSTLFAQLAAERANFGNTSLNLQNTNINIHERLLALLPPDVRTAVQQFATPTPDTDQGPDDAPTPLISRRQRRLREPTE